MSEEAKAESKPKFIKPVPREKLVALDHPFELDGVVYETVRVKRVSAGEVMKFMNELVAMGPDIVPPMVEMSAEAYLAMDDDDRVKIEEAALDFLPRRLRMASD